MTRLSFSLPPPSLSSALQNVVVHLTPCWVWFSLSPSLRWESSHSASSTYKAIEPLWMITPCTGQSVCMWVCWKCVLVFFTFKHFFISVQGNDRRHHPTDPCCPDWPYWAAGHPPSLPPLHHPLHCCCFHPAVNAGDSRPHSPGPGSIQRQVQ